MAGQIVSAVQKATTKKRKRETEESQTKPKRPKQRYRRSRTQEPVTNGSQEVETAGHVQTRKSKTTLSLELQDGELGWRMTEPVGGTMLDIDPILTVDEQYLILIYNTSIQVHSAVDSLLIKRIPITTFSSHSSKSQPSKPAVIVATQLSCSDSNHLWVACSDGHIFHIDWMSWSRGKDVLPTFRTHSRTARDMKIIPGSNQGLDEDVVLVAEWHQPNELKIVTYNGTQEPDPKPRTLLALKNADPGLCLLQTCADGRYVAGALNNMVFVGAQRPTEKGEYEIFSFDCVDLVTCFDLRVRPRSRKEMTKTDASSSQGDALDLVIGGARGGIYIYRDVYSPARAFGQAGAGRVDAQKFHWHPKAVHCVKWSPDGHYFVSGGSENVLVLWQIDTGKREYLPHLSGAVENIVVSASGSSYVLHLDDNSAMILSTAEMTPTAYVSGIQTAVSSVSVPKDLLVKRTWKVASQVHQSIPAAVRPSQPSHLHVCVGSGRQATMSGEMSAPFLQSIDLDTLSSLSKQALARTQLTDRNMTDQGFAIDDPFVSHIAFSNDGKWLASVHVWKPPIQDFENINNCLKANFVRDRTEVYLKFWDATTESMVLVTRINNPHATNHAALVLDLTPDTSSNSFATIGADGVVRVWQPRPRHQVGTVLSGDDNTTTFVWGCSRAIAICHTYDGPAVEDDAVAVIRPVANAQGSVAFSEDGSVIFAAFGSVGAGSVHVIDAASGSVVKTLGGLWQGRLRLLCSLASSVVILSDDLRVYDVVANEQRYGLVLPKGTGNEGTSQLSVDSTSGHFCVALPHKNSTLLGLFHPEEIEPYLVRRIPHTIVSLVATPGASGFIALDDAAQIWVIVPGASTSALATVQPLQEMQLDHSVAVNEDAPKLALPDTEDAEMGSESESENDEAKEEASLARKKHTDSNDDHDDYENLTKVVPQQFLTDIFNTSSTYTGSSIEDLFYKVTGLLATDPLPAA